MANCLVFLVVVWLLAWGPDFQVWALPVVPLDLVLQVALRSMRGSNPSGRLLPMHAEGSAPIHSPLGSGFPGRAPAPPWFERLAAAAWCLGQPADVAGQKHAWVVHRGSCARVVSRPGLLAPAPAPAAAAPPGGEAP